MEHHVYFWLKSERNNEDDRKCFEQGLRDLCQSTFLTSSHWGMPAQTKPRPVTDHSFAYALSLKFSSMEDHNSYQEGDPVHDAFITKFKDWWEKVLVMDVA